LPKPTDNHTSDLEIRELFKGFQVEAVSKVKWPGSESQPKHGWYAFVDLSTAAEAQRAMNQMRGIEKWGGNLTVNIASGTPKKVLDTMQRKEEQGHKEQQEDIHLNYDWYWNGEDKVQQTDSCARTRTWINKCNADLRHRGIILKV
jgi:hypothetical protein